MQFARLLLAILLSAAATASAATTAPNPMDPVFGTWRNPHGTIDVRTAPCAAGLCGTIVRASPKAVEDAKDSGIDQLIGLELLQDYSKLASGRWSGRVYVPDMGSHFSSRIELIGHDQLKISGCLIGGWFCKSQVWHRL